MKKLFSQLVLSAFALTFLAPLATFAATEGTVVIDTINGLPPASTCIAGAITIVGHGVTGSAGGPYNLAIEWGDGFITTQSLPSGGDDPFTIPLWEQSPRL